MLLLLLVILCSADATITFAKQCEANSRQQTSVNFLMSGVNNSSQPRPSDILIILISVNSESCLSVISFDSIDRLLIANVDGQWQMLVISQRKEFV